MLHRIVCILFLAFIYSSCQKNSNELPPVDNPTSKTIIISHKGANIIELVIFQDVAVYGGPPAITLRNISGSEIIDAKVYLEVCSQKNPGFNDCSIQHIIPVQNLAAGEVLWPDLSLFSAGFKIADHHYNAEFLEYNGKKTKLSGHHRGDLLVTRINGSLLYYEIAGYVNANGKTLLRINAPFSPSILTGTLINDSTLFNARIDTLPNYSNILLALDSFEIGGNSFLIDSTGGVGIFELVPTTSPFPPIQSIRISTTRTL